ncbi:MAG: single-stranded-DNA-specific exonuclease RecJ [Flammeovirgaceae bacterium]
MQNKQWVLKEQPDLDQVKALRAQINVSEAVAIMLLQRGITDFETAKLFFNPGMGQMYDPMLMEDMDKAVERLIRAVTNEEKILIYGDYDVDGTTAVSMFYGFLSKHYPNIAYYIPDRYQEGYGVSTRGIDYASKEGFSLIISLDCGIKAEEKIVYARELGIDFIICDHHTPPRQLPPAYAILDPKRTDCLYPYKELTGCGVGFKLLQAFARHYDIEETELFEYLDFLAVSTACDIVPITGENRVLVSLGLQLLNESPRTGFHAMMEVAGYHNKELNVGDVLFGIGPRINAAGRIAHANHAVELLLCEDVDQALQFAQNVDQKNVTRREYDGAMTEEALHMIEQSGMAEMKSTVLYKEDWHKGVVGIVASRCIEHYYRPTIILTESNGKATGSARSVKGFNIYNAIAECDEFLTQFGGHDFAAGMTLPIENIPAFRQRFEEVVAGSISPDSLMPTVVIDTEITLDQITWKFYNVLSRMAPFGPGNLQPLFVARNVTLDRPPRLLKEKHLKLSVQQGGQRFDAIGFSMPHYYARIQEVQQFDIAFHIDKNTFNGQTNLQLRLKDIKFSIAN